MSFAVLLLVGFVLFLLAGAIPLQGGIQAVIFRTPMFILLVAVLAVVLIIVAARRPPSLKWAWFHLLHLGPVAISAGAMIGFFWGTSLELPLPLSGEPLPVDQELLVSAIDFRVSYFDPAYRLYAPEGTNGLDYTLVKTAWLGRDGWYDFGSHAGRISGFALKDPAMDRWVSQRPLTNGLVLQIVPPTPRHYAATLRFDGPNGDGREEELAVNHPVDCRGWRFYLTSYDKFDNSWVVVSASRDPGRHLVAGGIWMVIVGAALACFRRKAGAE